MSKPGPIITVLLLLPLLLRPGHSQAPFVTSPVPLKMLIIPIYPQHHSYSTIISVMEASGMPTTFKVREFTEDGSYVQGEGEDRSLSANASEAVSFHPLFLHKTIENGWAWLIYPSNRKLHAVSTVWKYKDDEIEYTASSAAVEPATAFRFGASRWEGRETAISIINPTENDQEVTIQMYAMYGKPLRRPIEASWTIGPMGRLSRFLSELLPLEESVGNPHDVGGVVRIIGESLIAVGALGFSHETGEIWNIPVVAEPTLEAAEGTTPPR